MKKILALFAILFAMTTVQAAMSPAQTFEYVNTSIKEQGSDYLDSVDAATWKAYVEGFVSFCESTNMSAIVNASRSTGESRTVFWYMAERMTPEEVAPYDARLAKVVKFQDNWWFTCVLLKEYSYFPQACEAFISGWKTRNEYLINFYRHCGKHESRADLLAKAAYLNYQVSKFYKGDVSQAAVEFFTQATRMKLFQRSSGFIVRRDGSNPLKDVFDQVTTCLNAPRQQGLKQLVEEYAPGYKWLDVKYPTDMETMVLVGDILNGKIGIDSVLRGKLFFTLGAEQYNEFVRANNARQE